MTTSVTLGDIFNDCWNPTVGGHGIGSPGSPRNQASSQPGSPNGMGGCQDPSTGYDFKYGQEEAGERIEILQQPLALGYLVSTAPTGPMPRWFWSSCPHLEQVCPVFLKSALHINVASVQHGGDDAFGTTQSSSGRLHSLDSTYTADVLRLVSFTSEKMCNVMIKTVSFADMYLRVTMPYRGCRLTPYPEIASPVYHFTSNCWFRCTTVWQV